MRHPAKARERKLSAAKENIPTPTKNRTGREYLEISAPMPGQQFHYSGRHCIVTERQGETLLYDVFLNSGQIVAVGFDMLSCDEETALEGILSRRLNGKGRAEVRWNL